MESPPKSLSGHTYQDEGLPRPHVDVSETQSVKKKTKNTRSCRVPSRPSFDDMVLVAVGELRGASRQKIVRYIQENFQVPRVRRLEKQITLALRRCLEKGALANVRGQGATGTFKINNKECSAAEGKPLAVQNKLKTSKTKPKTKSTLVSSKGKENMLPVPRHSRAARTRAQARMQKQMNDADKVDATLKDWMAEQRKERTKWRRGLLKKQKRKNEDDSEEEEFKPSDDEETSGTEEKEDVESDDGLCEYERQRLRKIQENRALMAAVGLFKAKEDLCPPAKKLREKREKEPIVLEPTRRSLRIQMRNTPSPPPTPTPTEEEKEFRLPHNPGMKGDLPLAKTFLTFKGVLTEKLIGEGEERRSEREEPVAMVTEAHGH